MQQDLIRVAGNSIILLITALGDYFGPAGTREFCDILQRTESWILGSFALMAVAQATSWTPGDIDIYMDYHSPSSAAYIALLTAFFARQGYEFLLDDAYDGDQFETLTFKRSTPRIRSLSPGSTHKVQLIVDKNELREPFPLRVLKQFDVSCCCCGFDGVDLYKTAWNIEPMFFTMHDKVRKTRVEKYRARGFSFAWRLGPDPIDSDDDLDPIVNDLPSSEERAPRPEVAEDIDDNDAPVRAPPAIDPVPPPFHPPATCQAIIQRTKVPCGRLLIEGRCPIHK